MPEMHARLSADEFDKATADPGRLPPHLEALDGSDRLLSTGETWDALAFLLRRAEFGVDAVFGEADVPGAGNIGYGPPRYLAPNRVRLVAERLSAVDRDRLAVGVDPSELADACVYHIPDWGRGMSPAVGLHHFDDVAGFFAAARDGDVIVCWIA